jgi:hypothetical protein
MTALLVTARAIEAAAQAAGDDLHCVVTARQRRQAW